MACEDENEGPVVSIAQPTGTTPCPADADPIVCPPQACCNYYQLPTEGLGMSFIFSAGGPFAFPDFPACATLASCPPSTEPVALPPTPDAALFLDPGPLADVICATVPPGTYQATARFQVTGATPGTRIVVLYRPNCDDAAVEYEVCDSAVPCPPWDCDNNVGGVFPNQAVVTLDSSCFLYVDNPACNPGFRVLVTTGCVGGTAATTPPLLTNFQFGLERLSPRLLANCGGNPLQEVPDPNVQPSVPVCLI